MTPARQIAWARGKARAARTALAHAERAANAKRIAEWRREAEAAEAVVASLTARQQPRGARVPSGSFRTAAAFLERVIRAESLTDARLLAEEGLQRTFKPSTPENVA